MKMFTFSKRCAKEILRDPINIMFGLGFPVILLLLLSAIQANIPVRLFEIGSLVSGVSVFGLSFMSLFASTLIAKDRESSFLHRLYTTPLKSYDFILGYMLPVVPLAIAQSIICFVVAVFLGLSVNINVFYAVLAILPIALFHISFGLLCGSLFSVKQVGGVCGALLTNLSAMLSGVWFDLELVGGTFVKIAELLPFVHAVRLEKAVLGGSIGDALPSLYIVIVYTVVVTVSAVLVFLRQMKK